ncbi:hypothetical protein DAT35_30800 [Vitiosangium sp. GDMCC 1.1324]|nr:hypothetical protein DAT35_30800 [Vitiosangium sp. GDMCC 1.1324]
MDFLFRGTTGNGTRPPGGFQPQPRAPRHEQLTGQETISSEMEFDANHDGVGMLQTLRDFS